MLLQMTADALTIGYPMRDKIEGIKTIKFYVFTTQSYDKIIITFFCYCAICRYTPSGQINTNLITFSDLRIVTTQKIIFQKFKEFEFHRSFQIDAYRSASDWFRPV